MTQTQYSASQLPVFRIVGFTGHRQVDDPKRIAAVLTAAFDYLKTETQEEWIALSSVAAGIGRAVSQSQRLPPNLQSLRQTRRQVHGVPMLRARR